MIHINEWDPVPWGVKLPPDGQPLQRACEPADAITEKLRKIKEDAPSAVHFFEGEGLRWIRVGFGRDRLRQPADVKRIGKAIRSGLRPSDGPLYFQALRAYDMLFFLPGGQADSKGMEIEYFGVPVDEVVQAWG